MSQKGGYRSGTEIVKQVINIEELTNCYFININESLPEYNSTILRDDEI